MMAMRALGLPLASLLSSLAFGATVQAQGVHSVSAERPVWLVAQAIAHEHGEGVPKDPLKAASLYCEAAKLGSAEAQYGLGWMYANGRGLPRDNVMASVFFKMAADQGHEQAAKMLRFVGAHEAAELPECMRDPPRPENAFQPDELPAQFNLGLPKVKQVVDLVHRLAPEYSIDPRLALAVISAESNFEASARSPKNAQGLMQLIPETAERFNVRNVWDPAQNIRGGLAYLRWLLAYFKGDVALVAAGYNAGEGAVDRYRGVPPYQETRAYVQRILRLFRQEAHPYDARVTTPSPSLQARPLARRTSG
jgi:hypothetical protein